MTNFLEKVLNNPKDLQSIVGKDIDPLTHDFDSECLSDRLYSLYSVLLSDVKLTTEVKKVMLKYQPELAFLKEANKPNSNSMESLYEKLKKCKS